MKRKGWTNNGFWLRSVLFGLVSHYLVIFQLSGVPYCGHHFGLLLFHSSNILKTNCSFLLSLAFSLRHSISFEAIPILLKHKANMKLCDIDGSNPIQYSCEEGRLRTNKNCWIFRQSFHSPVFPVDFRITFFKNNFTANTFLLAPPFFQDARNV